MKLKKLMHDFLQDYLNQNKIEFSEWSVNVNNQEGFGDYSSNICLLYTSPSPRDLSTSRMPSSA